MNEMFRSPFVGSKFENAGPSDRQSGAQSMHTRMPGTVLGVLLYDTVTKPTIID